MPDQNIWVAATNVKGDVTHIQFPEAVLRVLFKTQNMPRKEFMQTFIDNYDVPSLDAEARNVTYINLNGIGNGQQVVYVHRSDKGFELNFYDDLAYGDGIVKPAPGTLELKAIKTAKQRQSAFD